MFAGVGGFRCGLNNIRKNADSGKKEKWKTVWFNQWEPADKTIQWAYDCYVNHFGTTLDIDGKDTTNLDINKVDKSKVPDFNLLVGGFPCQDYSVASTLASSKGLEGKKGILWWDIRDMIEEKQPAFVLLENVDRLLKSPAKQRGRDFGIILACFRDLGYSVEWRVINAAEYGYQQRRRRTFIFASKTDTTFWENMFNLHIYDIIQSEGFFAKAFPIEIFDKDKIKSTNLPEGIGELSSSFKFDFENSGFMYGGDTYTVETTPKSSRKQITLGDILEKGKVSNEFFIDEDRLYYTDHSIEHSDETVNELSKEAKHTWQYIKGAKKIWRKSSNGHEYIYSEGPIPMIDSADKPARTMLTSEGSFNRSTHIVKDKKTGNIRLLTPIEMERIQGFPDNWTKECLIDGAQVEMPLNKRRFMMGNALVVDLIRQMEPVLSDIFENEYLFSGKQNSEEPPFLTLNDHTEITYSDIKRNKHGQEYVTIHFETPIANKLASMDINTDDDVLRHVKGYTAGKVTEMIDQYSKIKDLCVKFAKEDAKD